MGDITSENPKGDNTESIGSPHTNSSNEIAVKDIDISPLHDSILRHVLVVEDDPIILYLLQDVLSASGFKVLVAKNAPDGLSLFQNYSDSTFCVILDYGIPGMHAARLLERMLDIQSDVKVILSSGYPQTFIKEDFPIEKLAGFLAKPYDPQVLISELKRLKTAA